MQGSLSLKSLPDLHTKETINSPISHPRSIESKNIKQKRQYYISAHQMHFRIHPHLITY